MNFEEVAQLEANIDFNKAGVYIVYLKAYPKTIHFPIQVVNERDLTSQ